jgi:Xaa-Pro aminopeptidase
MELMKAGKLAADVVKEYENFVEERGFKKYMLYGPCHGIGMMEVERPWMESTSTYALQENMTFQVDTFFYDTDFGLRWENGVRVTKKGVERQSEKYMKLVEL